MTCSILDNTLFGRTVTVQCHGSAFPDIKIVRRKERMCWSKDVSFAFGCLDLVFVAILLYKKSNSNGKSLHGVYAAFLTSIAAQEWSQYAVWKHQGNLKDATNCSHLEMLYSLGATGSAQVVPLVLLVGAIVTRSDRYLRLEEDIEMFWSKIRWSLSMWLAQFLIIVACVVFTGMYCVTVGTHHHQVWICASAVYQAGGYPLYFLTLVQYLLSAIFAIGALPLSPLEKSWIYAIGITNGLIAYGLYCWTLEACSIWCWSAFTYGIFFCVKDEMNRALVFVGH